MGGNLTNASAKTYTYGDSDWGDLLTAYDGAARTYDAIGNLLTDGTWTYTWQNGRELASMSNGSTTWRYIYDANGMRTSRSNGSATYSYVYNGNQLTQMTKGSDTLYFTYGAIGPTTVTWNGTTYYYAVNGQGDVMGILTVLDVALLFRFSKQSRLRSKFGAGDAYSIRKLRNHIQKVLDFALVLLEQRLDVFLLCSNHCGGRIIFLILYPIFLAKLSANLI